MLYSKKDILSKMPHREPFLFIDSCESVFIKNEININKDICGCYSICNYKVDGNNPIFKGHFPDIPVLPGVIHAEIMAQSSFFIFDQLLIKFKDKLESLKLSGNKGALLAIDSLKLKKPIFPNMELVIKTEIINTIMNIVVIKSTIINKNDGKILSTGNLKLGLTNF